MEKVIIIGRMEEDQLKKLQKSWKKPEIGGRMEEAIVVEKGNNFKLEKTFFFLSFSMESWKIGRRPLDKTSEVMAKNLKKLEEWKKQ